MGASAERHTPRVATASFPGPKHIANGDVRQDAACAKAEPMRAVLAVADGHGDPQYKYAHWGSTLGAQIACDVLWEFTAPADTDEQIQNRSPNDEDVRRLVLRIAYLWRQRTSQLSILFERWDAGNSMASKSPQAWAMPGIDELRNPLPFEARELATSLADKELSDLPSGASDPFGTTLLAAAIWGDHLLLLRMGDGAIIVAPASGEPFAWNEKSKGKAFGNKTASLVGSADKFEWELFRLSAEAPTVEPDSAGFALLDPRFIVLVTDGVSDPYVEQDAENERLGLPAYSARLLGGQIRPRAGNQTWQGWCGELTGFLASLSRESGDDATLAALDVTDLDCWWADPAAEPTSQQQTAEDMPPEADSTDAIAHGVIATTEPSESSFGAVDPSDEGGCQTDAGSEASVPQKSPPVQTLDETGIQTEQAGYNDADGEPSIAESESSASLLPTTAQPHQMGAAIQHSSARRRMGTGATGIGVFFDYIGNLVRNGRTSK